MERFTRNRPTLAVLVVIAGLGPAVASWPEWPPGPRDSDLEAMVRAAYTGASLHARANLNYFMRDGDSAGLQQAIETELQRRGHSSLDVTVAPARDLETARTCPVSGTVVRFAVNIFGDGISLVAASPRRVFSYNFEPRESAEIVVAPAEPCDASR